MPFLYRSCLFTFCTKVEKDVMTTLKNILKRISWQNMTRLVRQQCIKYLLKGCINIETSFFQWCKWRYIYQMATDKTNFSQIHIDTIAWRLESLLEPKIFFFNTRLKGNKSDRKCLAVMFLCTNLTLFIAFGFKTDS